MTAGQEDRLLVEALVLPWPPSVNGYWRSIVRGKSTTQILCKRGREYKGQVRLAALCTRVAGRRYSERLRVRIELYPPTRRRCDVDNFSKAILDSLTECGVWLDDEQVDELTLVKRPVAPGGKAVVWIWGLGGVDS